ncbi:LysM domain-containing protein [Paenarthrobacter sp. NPDC089322]|uniref:LysM peptidoglycan-binding domain-containing protein n=1 Tax=Paenarthrobacter sp. NPDC089322 TaxID=3155065 RepID=UPI00341FB0C0
MGQDDEATADQSAARQAADDAAAVGVSSTDTAAARSAAAQAAAQQEAANAAAAQEAARLGLNPDDPEVRQASQDAASEAAAGSGQPGPVAPRVEQVVVEAGDTMKSIAEQFRVDLAALIAANTDTVPNPDLIHPGQVLRLP